ncbi:MAG: hypothetical protein V1754_14485 [Pseudomonadota bacterium]
MRFNFVVVAALVLTVCSGGSGDNLGEPTLNCPNVMGLDQTYDFRVSIADDTEKGEKLSCDAMAKVSWEIVVKESSGYGKFNPEQSGWSREGNACISKTVFTPDRIGTMRVTAKSATMNMNGDFGIVETAPLSDGGI